MSAVDAAAPARDVPMPSRLELPEPSPLPFARLVRVELRKITDTRAGRWLLIAIALLTALVVGIVLFSGSAGSDKDFGSFVVATVVPQSILLPILGVLAVTAEWSQRTGLVTFSMEPRRSRVGWSKLVATLIFAVLAVTVALGLAALATVLGELLRGTHPDWDLPLLTIGGILVGQLLAVSQGVAFGMILQNTPAAIVAYLGLPTLWAFLGGAVSWLHTTSQWLDTNVTLQPLYDATMHGDQWAKLAVSVLVWVVAPLALGLWRLVRSEVK